MHSAQAQTTNRGLTIGKQVPPHQSAMLDIQSTEKGVLFPRMTQDQRDAIPVNSGSHGLMIFQTDNIPGLYIYLIDNAGQGSWTGLILSADLRGIERVLAEDNNANKLSLKNLQQLQVDTITSPTHDLYIKGNSYFSDSLGIGTTSPTQKLHVVGNGYFSNSLGIGTTSPTQKLHVVGNGYFSDSLGIGTINPGGQFHIAGSSKHLMLTNSTNANAFRMELIGDKFSFYEENSSYKWLELTRASSKAGTHLYLLPEGGNLYFGGSSSDDIVATKGDIEETKRNLEREAARGWTYYQASSTGTSTFTLPNTTRAVLEFLTTSGYRLTTDQQAYLRFRIELNGNNLYVVDHTFNGTRKSYMSYAARAAPRTSEPSLTSSNNTVTLTWNVAGWGSDTYLTITWNQANRTISCTRSSTSSRTWAVQFIQMRHKNAYGKLLPKW